MILQVEFVFIILALIKEIKQNIFPFKTKWINCGINKGG